MAFEPTAPGGSGQLCPQQVMRSPFTGGASATLSDPFGRAHPVLSGLFVGRVRAGFVHELLILESSVSRWHARVFFEHGQWWVRDLASKNGTFVGDQRAAPKRAVCAGQVVRFGDIGFVFSDLQTGADLDLSWSTAEGLLARQLRLDVRALAEGRGGVASFGGEQVMLSQLPFALLAALAASSQSDSVLAPDLCGFVPSRALLRELPWATAYPEENHLKQTVRRLRHGLAQLGLPGVIEAKQGHGYRLRPDIACRLLPRQ